MSLRHCGQPIASGAASPQLLFLDLCQRATANAAHRHFAGEVTSRDTALRGSTFGNRSAGSNTALTEL
jgi:hypothetical protein